MRTRKIFTLFIAIILVLNMVACGGNTTTKSDGAGTDSAATASGDRAPAATADSASAATANSVPAATANSVPAAAGDSVSAVAGDSVSAVAGDSVSAVAVDSIPAAAGYNVTWDDMAEIVVMYPAMSSIPPGLSAVEYAINEITEKEINTHVKLLMTESGSHDQQLNLMMSANEQLDLVVTIPAGASSFSSMVSQNQLKDITGLMETHAPRALATVGELIKGTQINGRTYGLTCYNSFASGIYINMRTDVLKDLGMLEKAEGMTSFTEFEELLTAVKNSEKWNYLAGIVPSDSRGSVLTHNTSVAYADKFADCKFMDNLGNSQAAVAVLDGSKTVEGTFATAEWRHNYEITKSWYDKGYVYKDSATTSEMGASLIKSNVAFAYTAQVELGSETSIDDNCGMDMTSVMITQIPITTGTLVKYTWGVPSISKEPEAAVTFLEMLFSDTRIANLFAWGVEGMDYQVGADGVAGYIEGNEEPAYHTVPFLNPNKFTVLPWSGDDPNQNELAKENMAKAIHSPFLGFSADMSAVTSEVGAITNVIAEYQAQIASGAADEKTYEAFLEKLETSGIGKIIETYQKQLDQWLEIAG